MTTKFSPSVNIIRDIDVDLNYIPTPNARKAFNQIVNNFSAGIKCFSIVGAYGTGKSSYLWAFEKTINSKSTFFSYKKGDLGPVGFYDTLSIIGDYSSAIKSFADYLSIQSDDFSTKDVLSALDKHYKKSQKNGNGLLISIDEFGKFLEFASQNAPEFELYFIQQLCEYINDPNKNILLIATLHQDFSSYSRSLTKNQRSEWDKIKGRLKEITFNEPVEQLLYLASERLATLDIEHQKKEFLQLFGAIHEANVFPLRDYCTQEIAENLLPFDILSASVLTLSLQKYGQNERSLFSFIESNDHLGLNDYNIEINPYYNLSCVYDYLVYNYYSFITSKYNPHFTQWSAIKSAIERAETLNDGQLLDYIKLIKTIGLLNIFSRAGATIDKDFLKKYGKMSLGISNPELAIGGLEKSKIIRFVQHSSKYVLFEGTDLDIELAINEAGEIVEQVSDVITSLNKYFDFPYVPAKAIHYERGTPRFFEFSLSEYPIDKQPLDEVDGFINLIFSENLSIEQIKEASKKSNEAILYGWYQNTSVIKTLLREVEKVKKVRENNLDDKIALRELDAILDHQKALLNHYVMGSIFSGSPSIVWFFNGKKQSFKDQKSFNRVLSTICEKIYHATPTYKNEMVNKTKLSTPITTARKGFVSALVNNWQSQDLGFADDKFPPEKTIYLSLLKETGIHHNDSSNFTLIPPTAKSFQDLWNICADFLESTKDGKRNIQELVDILSCKPLKMKKGLIDFWLPIFLFVKRDDYALYGDNGYIPNISDDNLDLIVKKPKSFDIKAFDIDGVKLDLFNQYRQLVQQTSEKSLSNESFIETIKPFLVFYKSLPTYAKNTKRLSKKALALREAIASSKDPEQAFFEDFPRALGYSVAGLQENKEELTKYVNHLQASIKEIRSCFNDLADRFENYITTDIVGEKLDFPAYKERLIERLDKLKVHALQSHQKTFYQRLFSPLDDRVSWLNSMAQASVGKPLDNFSDQDELVLYDKFSDIIHELDNLCYLSKDDIDTNKENVLMLEITSFFDGLHKTLIRMPKSKEEKIEEISNDIHRHLSSDKDLNVAILTKLLKDQLRDE